MRTMRRAWIAIMALGLASCSAAGIPRAVRSGCFDYTFSADRTVYRVGSPVTLTVRATNVTGRGCYGHSCGGVTGWFDVADEHGRVVHRTSAVGVLCRSDAPRAPLVAPGRTVVWDVYTWATDAGDTPSPGSYTAGWHWMDQVSVHSPVIFVTRA